MRIRTFLLAAALAAGAALPGAASAQRYGDGYYGQPRYGYQGGYQGGYQDRRFDDRFDRRFDRRDQRRWEQRRRWEQKQRWRAARRHHRFADGYRDYGYRY